MFAPFSAPRDIHAMSLAELKATIARDFGTPAVVIDLDRVEANIARVQALCDKAGVANRAAHQDAQDPGVGPHAGSRGCTGHYVPKTW